MMTNGDNRSGRETFDDLTGAQTLGMVVSGSLTDGMVVRLDADRSIEEIKVGTFVNIQGQHMRFFGVVTDAALASMDPSMPTQPPDVSDPFIAQVVSGTAAYGTITVEPDADHRRDGLDSRSRRPLSPPGQSLLISRGWGPQRTPTSAPCSARRTTDTSG